MIRATYRVRCDNCLALGPEEPTDRGARDSEQWNGWMGPEPGGALNDRDLCPSCRATPSHHV